MNFPSKILEDAVNNFSSLPGVGKKTALRYVLSLLKKDEKTVLHFSSVIARLKSELKYCKNCHLVSDTELCSICNNGARNNTVICVVENIQNVMAIENTMQHNGQYHVLGGILSPMDGIGPKDLNIESLIEKVAKGNIKEIIMALSTTMEGDTTTFYIYKRLKEYNVTVTAIARGISIGDELEYADEITLGKSISNRLPYEIILSSK